MQGTTTQNYQTCLHYTHQIVHAARDVFSHYFENHMKHINTRAVRNAVMNVKADGKHDYHYLKGSYTQNLSDFGGAKFTQERVNEAKMCECVF